MYELIIIFSLAGVPPEQWETKRIKRKFSGWQECLAAAKQEQLKYAKKGKLNVQALCGVPNKK